jgi:hypothetical protein
MDPATQQALLLQLSAVVVGGLLSIVGGFLSTVYLENRQRQHEAQALALAFNGEIAALTGFVRKRNYRSQIERMAEQVKASGEPTFMAFRVRYAYDRVYGGNVDKVGLLPGRLPELVPRFYTLANSFLEDMLNLGERVYAEMEATHVLRIYNDMARFLDEMLATGDDIVAEVDRLYG